MSTGQSYGDPHLITFDGYYYPFQSVGEFVLAQSLDSEIMVQSRQIPWSSSSSVSLNSAVAVNIGGDIVELYGLAFDTPTLTVNKSIVLLETTDVLELANGGVIRRSLNEYEFVWPDSSTVVAREVKGILSISVSVSGEFSGKMTGLLGNNDGNKFNDIVLRGETAQLDPLDYDILYGAYADSWRLTQATSLFSYAEGQSTAMFTDTTFPREIARLDAFPQSDRDDAEQVCLAAGVTDALLLISCMIDVMSTGDTEFADTAADVQQSLASPLVTSDLTVQPSAGTDCPCADTFTAFAMEVPPWESSFLHMRTAPGQGCSLSNDMPFLDNESMSLNGRAESQVCTASVGSSNLDMLAVEMTDEQYDSCLNLIENNARQWFGNGYSMEISRDNQSAVAVNSVDDIACLR